MDQKHKAMKRVKTSEDRISSLPDKVLSHILSHLTTAQSVRTSILSKRWLSVWSYVPVLKLNDSRMSFDDHIKELEIHSDFIQFLNNVFNRHKEDSLQKLTLHCFKFDSCRVNEWVISAMRCRVKELDLCTYRNSFKLCNPLFVYQDLVALKLGGGFSLTIPGEVLMPSLKKLHLVSITFSDEESCNKLLSGCPVLEYLHMQKCYMENVKTLQIIAHALEFLSLDYCSNVHSVVVDAPSLEVFWFECPLARRYSFPNLNCLLDAYIDVTMKHRDQSKTKGIRETSHQLVNGIANAKIIRFTGSTLEVLSFLDFTALPMFNYLTKLELGGHCFCAMLLPKFLANSPCLRDLVLNLGNECYNQSLIFGWHDPNQVPKCLLDSLKSVEIWGFTGQSNVIKFIKYLLSHGKVLAELLAGVYKGGHNELKTSKELLGFLLGK